MDMIALPFKTRPVCSYFSLSIPALNILLNFSKLIQCFSHTDFIHFFLFSAYIAHETGLKSHLNAKFHYFSQKYNRFLSKPIQNHSATMVFSMKGLVISYQISITLVKVGPFYPVLTLG